MGKDAHTTDFEHLRIRSALGELQEAVRIEGTGPDLLDQIAALWQEIYDVDNATASERIRQITHQAWNLAGPAKQNTSPTAKAIRAAAFRLDDVKVTLDDTL